MNINLLYGKSGLEVSLPDNSNVTLIEKNPMPLIGDPKTAVDRALREPVGCAPISELARGKQSACILVCDITRPVPNGVLLPPLIDALLGAGVPKDNIVILVATGLHRPADSDELREIVGNDDVFNSVRVENHIARDRDAHVDLGTVSGGIPVMIDRRFVEADLKIATGLVEPHFMAGYSGGRKVVTPGVAYRDTILHLHTPRVLEHPNSANCVVDGNPLHQIQIEVARKIGDILALNVVIDDKRRFGFVNFGEVEASHTEAVRFMRKSAEVTLPRRFKTIVTTSAGYPLDKTYYQTVKGMVGVLGILESGGTVIIASECSEGMGSAEFVEAQRLLREKGLDDFMSILESRDKALIDEWQTEMLVKVLRAGKVRLYTTGLTDADGADTCVEPVASVEEAVMASVEASGDRSIAVIPEGPYVVPFCKNSSEE